MESRPPQLYLVDGSGYIFRAFYGLPTMTRPDGTPVNAVFGFASMMIGLLEGNDADYLGVIFDAGRRNFRNDIYADYKANRDETPEALIPQFSIIREATEAFNLPAIEQEGYEADDLIATYAKLGKQQGMAVTIVSSDKDLMQLVETGISLWDPMKKKTIGMDGVMDKFGVTPDRVIDVQALAGDSSDNVPGVPGIGIKTAAQLINEYGNLDQLLARAEEIKQPKRREALIEFAEQARISRQLVTLEQDVPLATPIEGLARKTLEPERLKSFFMDQGFKRLLGRIPDQGRDPSMRANAPSSPPSVEEEAIDPEWKTLPFDGYECVRDQAALDRWCAAIRAAGHVAIDTETTGLDIIKDRLVGISLCYEAGKACYIPLIHIPQTVNHDLFGQELAEPQSTGDLLPLEVVKKALAPILTDSGIIKIGHNLKFDLSILAGVGLTLDPIDDTMLLSFALEAGLTAHGMDKLAVRHLNHEPISFESVAGKGAKQLTFDKIDLEAATRYAAEDADVTFRLWLALKPQLRKKRMTRFYERIERPLPSILAKMEQDGIKVDTKMLKSLGQKFTSDMQGLEQEIYALAGEEFNLASPKQMEEILFGKLGLPAAAKTGTGARSTNVAVLEPLAETYPIAAKILHWRMLAKLKSTYCEALITAANNPTARVHTAFSMVGALTGRLSSSDPNLQNIPARTEEGRLIRKAFIAEAGYKLVSLDYSQIELRLLAQIADIDPLRQAFIAGADIHKTTASEVFGIAPDQLTAEHRRRAKAVNFGIIYGMSAFGLAKQIQVSQKEAKEFIDRYFARFPGIRDYMSAMSEFCQLNGYVETLFGRRIHIPAIHDSNQARVGGARRQAINAPIQGSVADIIKRAMWQIPPALQQAGLDAGQVRMLLQVHDELIFEIKEDALDRAIPLLQGLMERAAIPMLSLTLPLKVDCGIADNWAEAH